MKKIMYLLIVSLLIITTPVFAQDDVVKVPVLMYHAVDTEYNGSWTINKNNLELDFSTLDEYYLNTKNYPIIK